MIHIIKKFRCIMKGHSLTPAGSCPYTGATYYYCDKCDMMIPVEVVQ